jgi:hypothetical protein
MIKRLPNFTKNKSIFILTAKIISKKSFRIGAAIEVKNFRKTFQFRIHFLKNKQFN